MHRRENITKRLYSLYCFTFRVLGPDSLRLNFQILLTKERIQHIILFVPTEQLETLMKQSFSQSNFFPRSCVLCEKRGTS